MGKKHKHQQKTYFRPGLVAAILVLGALTLIVQTQANLLVRATKHVPMVAIMLGTPRVSPPVATPSPKPAATATQAPAPAPAHILTRPRVVVSAPPSKPPPPVVASPHSVVSHLVAVAQPPVTPGKGNVGPSPTTSPSPSNSPSPSTSPTPTPGPAPVYGYTSSNWAGYLAPSGGYSGVNASWTVPGASGNGRSLTADATWIGIGGVTSSDLIQVGTTDFVSRGGQVTSNAFYEMLPASETPVPGMTIGPGDQMSASVTQLAGSQWQISISNSTRQEAFSINVTYASTNSTAEWIEEDPSYSGGSLVPFDRFGSTSFSGASVTAGGTTENLVGAGAQAIIMLGSSGLPVATPSAVDGAGAGFSVTGG